MHPFYLISYPNMTINNPFFFKRKRDKIENIFSCLTSQIELYCTDIKYASNKNVVP